MRIDTLQIPVTNVQQTVTIAGLAQSCEKSILNLLDTTLCQSAKASGNRYSISPLASPEGRNMAQIRLYPRKHGFTLVELLVVIGIIVILISLLLPALSKVRVQALKVQDVSNIKQMALAVLDYAANNKGAYPVGTRADNTGDSLTWTSPAVADYLMQYCHGPQFTYLSLTAYPDLGRALSCNSVYESLPAVNSAALQPSYYSSGAVALGWDYFGGRLLNKISDYGTHNMTDTFNITLLNPDLTSAGPYYVPIKAGITPTSRTLFTCLHSFGKTTGGTVPHWSKGYAAGNVSSMANPYLGLGPIDGISMSYTDGSARFVPKQELGVISGPYMWFYDKAAMN
jgi:prepilin-type N-terminal cleavage/methylation domain-containing protein